MPEDRIEPYVFASGAEKWGDEALRPIPTYGSSPGTERLGTFVQRARLASRRLKVDPTWGDRTPESRAHLIDLDLEENR
jgi:hypothetical protein